MGFFSGLVGSSPSSSLGSASTQTYKQEKLLEQVLNSIRNQGFTGKLEPGEQEAINLLLGRGRELEGGAPQVELPSSYSPTEDKLVSSFEEDPQLFEDYFKAAVQDPALREFTENILPAITRRHSRTPFGGQREKAEAGAREDLLQQLTQARAQTAFDTYNQAQNRGIQALGLAPGIQNVPLQQFALNTQAQQNVIPQLLQVLQGAGTGPNRRNQEIQQALAGSGLNVRENIQTVQGGSAGIIPSLISGGAQVGSAYAGRGGGRPPSLGSF